MPQAVAHRERADAVPVHAERAAAGRPDPDPSGLVLQEPSDQSVCQPVSADPLDAHAIEPRQADHRPDPYRSIACRQELGHPSLGELILEGCALEQAVPTAAAEAPGAASPEVALAV